MQFLFQNNEEKDDVTEHHRAMRISVIQQVLVGKTPIQMVNMYEDAQIVKSYPCICVSMTYPVNFYSDGKGCERKTARKSWNFRITNNN